MVRGASASTGRPFSPGKLEVRGEQIRLLESEDAGRTRGRGFVGHDRIPQSCGCGKCRPGDVRSRPVRPLQ
jgi:hypothetical protein